MKFYHLIFVTTVVSANLLDGLIPSLNQNLESKLATSSLDLATVYNGAFDPNNVAIHVMQNFVNFVAGTVFW